jgi:Glycosyl transferase family 2
MSDLLFSIVIPTYNRAKLISKAITSLLDQNETQFEIIVVDDGSTDNTSDVVLAITDKRIRYFIKDNEERAAARNFGARQAKGKFVGFLDSDDYVYPHHLTIAKKFVEAHPGAKVFHLGYELRDAEGPLLRKVSQQSGINEHILSGNTLSANGVFVERAFLLQNPFNAERRLSSLEDWELWIRLAGKALFYDVNEITSVVVQHEERSVMSSDIPAIRSKVDVFCKLVAQDKSNQSTFGNKLKKAVGSARTYAALHIAIAGDRKIACQYLLDGLRDDISQIFSKRFVVILLYLFRIRK